MRKSLMAAIAVEIIVLVIAFAFSFAYIQFGVGRENPVLSIGLIILWVLVAGVLLLVFWWRSLVREEMVRRFFVSDEWVYNHEIGYAPMSKIAPDGDAYGFVTFAADALARMAYGFDVADVPEQFSPKFVIASRVFRYHLSGDGEDGETGGQADGIVVVDQWRGSLQRVERDAGDESEYADVGKFENARELARLLEDNGAFSSIHSGGGY